MTHDKVVEILHAGNTGARKYCYLVVRVLNHYTSHFPISVSVLTNSETVTKEFMNVLTRAIVDAEFVDKICELINLICTSSTEIRQQLS